VVMTNLSCGGHDSADILTIKKGNERMKSESELAKAVRRLG
jgi:hypothetical protein